VVRGHEILGGLMYMQFAFGVSVYFRLYRVDLHFQQESFLFGGRTWGKT
jgi:hypothetical protein